MAIIESVKRGFSGLNKTAKLGVGFGLVTLEQYNQGADYVVAKYPRARVFAGRSWRAGVLNPDVVQSEGSYWFNKVKNSLTDKDTITQTEFDQLFIEMKSLNGDVLTDDEILNDLNNEYTIK